MRDQPGNVTYSSPGWRNGGDTPAGWYHPYMSLLTIIVHTLTACPAVSNGNEPRQNQRSVWLVLKMNKPGCVGLKGRTGEAQHVKGHGLPHQGGGWVRGHQSGGSVYPQELPKYITSKTRSSRLFIHRLWYKGDFILAGVWLLHLESMACCLIVTRVAFSRLLFCQGQGCRGQGDAEGRQQEDGQLPYLWRSAQTHETKSHEPQH